MTEQHNDPGTSRRLLRPEEAQALLGISESTLLRYERRGLINATRTAGGHRRYLESDVEVLRTQGAAAPQQRSADSATAPAS